MKLMILIVHGFIYFCMSLPVSLILGAHKKGWRNQLYIQLMVLGFGFLYSSPTNLDVLIVTISLTALGYLLLTIASFITHKKYMARQHLLFGFLWMSLTWLSNVGIAHINGNNIGDNPVMLPLFFFVVPLLAAVIVRGSMLLGSKKQSSTENVSG